MLCFGIFFIPFGTFVFVDGGCDVILYYSVRYNVVIMGNWGWGFYLYLCEGSLVFIDSIVSIMFYSVLRMWEL